MSKRFNDILSLILRFGILFEIELDASSPPEAINIYCGTT